MCKVWEWGGEKGRRGARRKRDGLVDWRDGEVTKGWMRGIVEGIVVSGLWLILDSRSYCISLL